MKENERSPKASLTRRKGVSSHVHAGLVPRPILREPTGKNVGQLHAFALEGAGES